MRLTTVPKCITVSNTGLGLSVKMNTNMCGSLVKPNSSTNSLNALIRALFHIYIKTVVAYKINAGVLTNT